MKLARAWIASCSVLFSLASGQARAEDPPYPSRPVRVFVPFTPGTNADTVARLFAQKLSERLHQPFVVENKAGAGGVLASRTLLGSPADGYTLMLVSSAHAANPSLNKSLPYDTETAFSGVAMVGESATVIAVNPEIHVQTQKDLIARAKSGLRLNYSSPGIGSASHFACEFFRGQAGIEMVHVPFKGSEYVTELLSGRVQVACPPVGLVAPYLKAGKLVAVSVSSKDRLAALPDLPTAIEAGLPNFDYTIWYGMVASSKTPRPIVELLAREMSAIVQTPSVSDALAAQGITPRDVPTKRFDDLIRSEIQKLREIAKASNLVPE